MTTKKARTAKIRIAIMGLLVGLAIGIAGTLFFQQYNSKDPAGQNPNPAPVFDRIVAQNELVCASQQYNITEKATNSNSFFELFDIPFTENHFWYRYVGTIKVGVNLKEAEFATKDKVITVSLTQPYIISNTPDLNKSGTLEEGINPLNPIHAKDVDAFQRQCVEQSQTDIIDGGIMDEAKQNAEENIRDMFYAALGDAYAIEFQWRE